VGLIIQGFKDSAEDSLFLGTSHRMSQVSGLGFGALGFGALGYDIFKVGLHVENGLGGESSPWCVFGLNQGLGFKV
jgi:hypothetical protein